MASRYLILVVSIAILFSGDAAGIHEPDAAAVAPSCDGEEAGFSFPVIHWKSMAEVVEEEMELAATATAAAAAMEEEKFVVPFRHRRKFSMYLVQLRIGGGPPDEARSRYVLFDTGDDLSWTQCVPCKNCTRSYYLPFNPVKSSTYHHLPCEDPMCEHGRITWCQSSHTYPTADNSLCKFDKRYGDGSKVSGYLGSDVFRFGNGMAGDDGGYNFEQDIVFGCAQEERTTAVREYSSGILGLGMGTFSFVAQAGVDKFSYCALSPERRDLRDQWRKTTSYLRFGSHAVTSGKIVPFKQDGAHFIISLKSVTYQRGSRLDQNQPVPIFTRQEAAEFLPILVDSGSALVYLPGLIFDPLLKRIDDELTLTRVYDPTNNPAINCYDGEMSDVEGVSVTLGFQGGAELELFGDTLFYEGYAGDYICLGISIDDRKSVLGMIAQRNTNVGYDLANMEISFNREVCA
ncbi:aspartic proteinase nepenthesin-2-like [Triticum urartu]|nr:aspartic proteinase nepenthesin-2-like [Triticum urartu]XP_048545745.1 aspartic proteinase nepenthesin-2-like [Triticum urartu]XP_048546723.1 aspartic proteinase nepenthesin-2-like [Triticum urartu]